MSSEIDPQILIAVYKPESECTPADRKTRIEEKVKCKTSFVHFLKYCKLVVPPTKDNPGGVTSFEFWPHLVKAIHTLLNNNLIEWLKSRQVGASWLIAFYVLWYALHRQGAKIILISKGELEAIELLGKCYTAYKYLPDFMKLPQDPKSLTEMGFPIMDSSIKVLAATKTAGVSFTASVLVFDEHQDHPFAESNYFAAKPTIDRGAQLIGIYTQSGETLDTFANVLFRDALEGKNNFVPMFTGWPEVPGRTQEWYNSTMRDIPKENLQSLTPELYMQRNYPATLEEAMMPLQTVAAFNLNTIMEMMGDTRNPISIVRDGVDTNIVHLYKDFHLGNYFIAATDTAHGVGKDYSVSVIMNVKTGEVIADIVNNVIPPEELAMHTIKMLEIFKNPLWWIESNDYGGVTITTAQTLGYKNLGSDKKIGFDTKEVVRNQLWGALIPAVNNRQITIYNKEGLKQFNDIIRNAKKQGRIEAMSGRHDDYPMAVGIAWLKKDEVITNEAIYKPRDTLHFRSRQYESRSIGTI